MKTGDKVRISTKEDEFEGIFMPRPDLFSDDYVVIKIESGYNIGIAKKNIKEKKILEEFKESKPKKSGYTEKKGLKKISILHTGGTIASKVDYRSGGVIAAFTPEDLVSMFPELTDIANIDSELIVNMWSDDLRFSHFKLIADTIEKKVKEGTDGIIIGMGTDNLAVAAAALSFIVEESPVPIIFVGAQRSSDRGSSDAAMNLICAASFIVNSNFSGVALCMHEHTDDDTCLILPANKTKKMHSSRRDAFKPVNTSAIARINYSDKKIELLTETKKGKNLILKPKMEDKVGILKISINMFPEQFELYKGWKGLVLEGTGLGHAPIHVPNDLTKIHKKIENALSDVIRSGCIVVMTTNCIFGRVGMNVYSKGRDLQKMGVIPGEDMLAETAMVKLSWLLANHPKDARDLIRKNLRGEINDRLSPKDFL